MASPLATPVGMGEMPGDLEDSSEESHADERPWFIALPYCTSGDVDAFCGLFSNNLATLLAGARMLQPFLGDQIIFGRILPGVGVAMAFGCAWYVVQAQLLAAKTGNTNLCAQPFGINTPGVFAFNSNIILHTYFAQPGGEREAANLAWQVGVIANFLQGCVEIGLAAAGPWISEAVPMVSLLGSLGSIGLAFLFTSTLQTEAFWPVVTFPAMFLLFMAFYANVTVPKVPSTFLPIVLGTALAWASGKAKFEDVTTALEQVGWYPPMFDFEAFGQLSHLNPYIGVAIPLALTVAVGTIQCRKLAANAGDSYSIRWSMLGDGLATVIAALLGSPWGMTVFIGHPAFKSMGAKIGYNLWCAVGFLVVCFSGLGALVLAMIPGAVLNLIILFVGLAVCCDALDVTLTRHWPAFLVSLVPGFCNWAVQQCQHFSRQVCHLNTFTYFNGTRNVTHTGCTANIDGAQVWGTSSTLRGLYAVGEGYLLTSIFLSAMLFHITDRNFLKAAIWAGVAAFFSSVGLAHSDTVFLPWMGPADTHEDMHWDFVVAYLTVGCLFLTAWGLQYAGFVARGPVADEERCVRTDDMTKLSLDCAADISENE